MNLVELSELVVSTIKEKIDSGIIVTINPQDGGLHEKSGLILLDTETKALLIHASTHHKFKFYGGFEYVDANKVVRLNDFIIYLPDIDRVQNVFEIYEKYVEKETAA